MGGPDMLSLSPVDPDLRRKELAVASENSTIDWSTLEWGMLDRSETLSSDDSEGLASDGSVETQTGQGGVNQINFEPTGFSSVPREPETLAHDDKVELARRLETLARAAGRPHRIPGTLAQSKIVTMLLDTGAPCSLMPKKLFLQLQQFKPNLTLTATTRALRGVEGTPLQVLGTAVVDVEIAGRFLLVPFTVVDVVQEVILGMDFLHLDGVEWNVAKGELHLGEGGTVFTRNSSTGPTLPSSKAQLVGRTVLPASSLVKVKVRFRTRGKSLPKTGMLRMTGRAAGRHGVVVTRSIIDPGEDGVSTVFVMNPTEQAVELPAGTTVGVLEPVVTIKPTDPAAQARRQIRPVFSQTPDIPHGQEASSVGEEGSGYDGSSEASADSWSVSSTEPDDEGGASGMHAKATAPRLSDNHPPSAHSSLLRTSEEGGPEALSELVNLVSTPADDENRMAPSPDAAPIVQEPGDEDDSVPEHLQKLYDATAEELHDEQDLALVRGVLRRNADIFARDATDLGSTNVATHSIDTGDRKPIKQAPRRIALHRQDIVKQEVEKMLEKGIIEPCDGPWSSPIVLVKKKDGSLRFCIDYRKLNEATLKDAYPLPRIEDNLDTLGGSTWFSTLDLISGFWQVELDDDAKAKSAFSVGRGGLY